MGTWFSDATFPTLAGIPTFWMAFLYSVYFPQKIYQSLKISYFLSARELIYISVIYSDQRRYTWPFKYIRRHALILKQLSRKELGLMSRDWSAFCDLLHTLMGWTGVGPRVGRYRELIILPTIIYLTDIVYEECVALRDKEQYPSWAKVLDVKEFSTQGLVCWGRRRDIHLGST